MITISKTARLSTLLALTASFSAFAMQKSEWGSKADPKKPMSQKDLDDVHTYINANQEQFAKDSANYSNYNTAFNQWLKDSNNQTLMKKAEIQSKITLAQTGMNNARTWVAAYLETDGPYEVFQEEETEYANALKELLLQRDAENK